MLNAPLVALAFNEGSGTTTANTGTLGGSAAILGSFGTANPASARAGSYVTPGTAAAAATFNIAPDAYAADGIYTRAMLVRFDTFSGPTRQDYLDDQGTALSVVFFGPDSFVDGQSRSRVFRPGEFTDGGNVPHEARYPWTLMAMVGTGAQAQVFRVDAAGVNPERDAVPFNMAVTGSVPSRLVIGGSFSFSGQNVAVQGALDSYTVHNAALSTSQLHELYFAAVRGHDLGREVGVNVTGAASLALTSDQGGTLDALGTASSLTGAAGNDTLFGSYANDVLDGGAGIDTLSYALTQAFVRVDLSITTPQQTAFVFDLGNGPIILGGDGTDTILNIENLIGSADQDTLAGNAGDNVIEGGGGNDVMDGRGGNDTASYASAASGVTVSLALTAGQNTGGAGTDTLSNFENLLGSRFNDTLLAGGDGSQVSGGSGDDVLFGTNRAQVLMGGAGNDVMLSSGVSDFTMAGGAGDDVYQSNHFIDTIQEAAGEGHDIVFFTHSGISLMPAHVEVGYLVGDAYRLGGKPGNDVLVANPTIGSLLSGSGGDDELWSGGGSDFMSGDDGNDVLRGGGGADTMEGGAGDDTYVLTNAGHIVREVTGQGLDTVYQTIANWTASANIEVVRLFGAGVSVTGTAAADMLVANAGAASTMNGAGGSDTIWGQDQADLLDGGAADDVLRGGGGHDTLVGGLGTDQLVGGAGADRFAFNAPGWGFDTVHDFNRGQGDRIDMTGSGVSGFGALAVQVIGPNTMLLFEASRIDVYGVTDLGAADFIFG